MIRVELRQGNLCFAIAMTRTIDAVPTYVSGNGTSLARDNLAQSPPLLKMESSAFISQILAIIAHLARKDGLSVPAHGKSRSTAVWLAAWALPSLEPSGLFEAASISS